MGTNILIDDKLMDQTRRVSHSKTKRDAVEKGLKLLIQRSKQERIKKLRGKLL